MKRLPQFCGGQGAENTITTPPTRHGGKMSCWRGGGQGRDRPRQTGRQTTTGTGYTPCGYVCKKLVLTIPGEHDSIIAPDTAGGEHTTPHTTLTTLQIYSIQTNNHHYYTFLPITTPSIYHSIQILSTKCLCIKYLLSILSHLAKTTLRKEIHRSIVLLTIHSHDPTLTWAITSTLPTWSPLRALSISEFTIWDPNPNPSFHHPTDSMALIIL